jgi:hypothetical protein
MIAVGVLCTIGGLAAILLTKWLSAFVLLASAALFLFATFSDMRQQRELDRARARETEAPPGPEFLDPPDTADRED